jgi:CDP-diacylglycerol--glycerol-3-phosphate 3-phosphatidyltransferase
VISAARILSVPVLVVLAYLNKEEPFKWLLLAAVLSDIADGLIARSFKVTSTLGAKLDSIGDALLVVAVVYGIVVFHQEFVNNYMTWFAIVLGLWVLTILISFLRYGRIASFHSYAMKVCGYALGIFVMVLFFWGIKPLIFYVAVIISVLAHLEMFVMFWLLPDWAPNVRGVYWILRKRRGSS